MMNKRGAGMPKFLVWLLFVLAVVGVFWVLAVSGLISFGGIDFDTTTQGFDEVYGSGFKFLNFIFGGVPQWTDSLVGPNSAAIITIAMFFLLFITFGDILAVFSTFSKSVSWFAGFLLAVIVANLKGVVGILAVFIGVFGGIGGGLAVTLGMLAAFVAFFAVNFGIGSLGPWIMRRKAMMKAQESDIRSQQGATAVNSAIKGMKSIGKELASGEGKK